MTSSRPPSIRPRLATDHVSGTLVLRANQVTVGYPKNALFTIKELELRRGECAVLTGPNGSGKTTFLKVLTGELQPLHGHVQLGASLKIGYFAQAHDNLKSERTVLDELQACKEMDAQQARSLLAQPLRGDDVFKQVSLLSGGERARLRWPCWRWAGPTSCCWMSPPITWDIPPASRCRRCWSVSRHHPARLARPLPHQPPRHPDLGSARAQVGHLQGQLPGIPAAPRGGRFHLRRLPGSSCPPNR